MHTLIYPFAALYGKDDADFQRQRYHALAEGLRALPQGEFPETRSGEVRFFSAPGRTELGGNHTDHNQGKVLAASIQMDAAAAVVPRKDKGVFFRSAGFPDVSIDMADLSPRPHERGKTESLVRGIARCFAERGVMVGGWTANAASTVLQGSGLSSSAAIEVLFAKIFDTLYGAGKCTALELARIGQKAENDYFGKPCGLEDQAASAFGGAIKIDFARKDAPLVTPVTFDPARAGYALCVVHTGGSHADLTPDYAAIPEEMRAVARQLGKNVLGETDRESLMQHAAEIRKTCGDRALLRALHFFDENERVEAMAAAVQRGDPQFMETFLTLVEASGDSSERQLQNIHSPSYSEEQGVTLALALSRVFFKQNNVRGVCRVHGGGFAGTIQAYVPLDAFVAYKEHMEATFGPGAVTLLRIRALGAVEVRM